MVVDRELGGGGCRWIHRWRQGWCLATTERAAAGNHNVSLVGPLDAGPLMAAVGRCSEEMRTGVDARGVDVVVFRKIAHCELSTPDRQAMGVVVCLESMCKPGVMEAAGRWWHSRSTRAGWVFCWRSTAGRGELWEEWMSRGLGRGREGDEEGPGELCRHALQCRLLGFGGARDGICCPRRREERRDIIGMFLGTSTGTDGERMVSEHGSRWEGWCGRDLYMNRRCAEAFGGGGGRVVVWSG